MDYNKIYVLDDSDLSLREDKVAVDFLHIIKKLLIRLPEIIAAALAVAVAVMLVVSTVQKPTYTSTTKINLMPATTGMVGMNTQMMTAMVTNCIDVASSRYVAEKAIDHFGLKMDYSAFAKKLSVGTDTNTSIMRISVSDPDPKLARSLAAYVRATAAREIRNTVGFGNMSVIEEANYPTKASSNAQKLALFGGLAAAVVWAGIICIQVIVADTRAMKAAKEADRAKKTKTANAAGNNDDKETKSVKTASAKER